MDRMNSYDIQNKLKGIDDYISEKYKFSHPKNKRDLRELHLACECVEKEKPVDSRVLTLALRYDSLSFRMLLKRIHDKIGDMRAEKANPCKKNTSTKVKA